MKVHINFEGHKLRCIANIQCPYGGPVGRTLTRGDYLLSPSEAYLPLLTTGNTARGGASADPQQDIERKKIAPEFQRIVQKRFQRRAPRTEDNTPQQGAETLKVDQEQWNAMTPTERGKHIRSIMDRVHALLEDQLMLDPAHHGERREYDNDKLRIAIQGDTRGSITATRDETDKDTLVIGRAFLAKAPRRAVWTALCHAYGNLLTADHGAKYNASWARLMKRAGIPTDFAFNVSEHEAYPLIATCPTCQHVSYRPDDKLAFCRRCKVKAKDSTLTFTQNPDYIG